MGIRAWALQDFEPALFFPQSPDCVDLNRQKPAQKIAKPVAIQGRLSGGLSDDLCHCHSSNQTMVTRDTLEPLEPSEAAELYLNNRKTDGAADGTVRAHRHRLGHFLEWCEEQEITNLNDITGRDLRSFKVWRSEKGSIARSTLKNSMDTLRKFMRFCESIEGVPRDAHMAVTSPTLSEDDANHEVVPYETQETILERLNRFQFASFEHVFAHLLHECGFRVGAVRSLDLEDFQSEPVELPDGTRIGPHIETHHRPATDTPLKNGKDSERLVALKGHSVEILTDYIQHQRSDFQDKHGRDPLLVKPRSTTRPTTQALRDISYGLTRPCTYGEECPHDRDPDSCEAARMVNSAYDCPSSMSPHPWRRAVMTHWRANDVPIDVVSDRFDVSPSVIEKHYDVRTKQGKMEQRRRYYDDL
ncbi:hypothetical protein DU504_14870 [Haloplanus salinus]|uniref:Core-binding (CB) domain-containing protein n=1 Tax=Haloplanus salinus TaxID=1126245 RepID=A0A368NEF2_9EURY|nr:hypothetical protein DU504_14870 [Haloplanus salinus]